MSSTAEKIQPFVCAGASACFASACIHPIDLAKVSDAMTTTMTTVTPTQGSRLSPPHTLQRHGC
jgi:hypothetical protein